MSFKEKLFGCCSDVSSCLFVSFIPMGAICLQASTVKKIRHQGWCIPYCIACVGGPIGSAINRERIREALSYHDDFWSDCLLWWCCGPCASCQENREIKKHYSNH